MASEILAAELTRYAGQKIRQNLTQIVRCVRLLDAEQIWHRANAHTNSVGNLMLHLAGNVRQWIVAGLDGQPFARDRQGEFDGRGGITAVELIDNLEKAVTDALAVFAQLNAARLAATHVIQGYEVSGLVAVCHVVEHFSWHVGQIVHITKTLADIDLSLYDSTGHKRAEFGVFP